jgi:hypothetical protein
MATYKSTKLSSLVPANQKSSEYFIRVMFKIHESWGGSDGDIINGILISGKPNIVKSYEFSKEKYKDGYGYFLAKIHSKINKQEFDKFLKNKTTTHTEWKIL